MSKKVSVKKFRKVLVANRGEIAIRIFRALSELGITTVSIYSKEDRYAMFRSKADESYPLNPQKGPIDAYLDIDTIIQDRTFYRSRCESSGIWLSFRKSGLCRCM